MRPVSGKLTEQAEHTFLRVEQVAAWVNPNGTNAIADRYSDARKGPTSQP